MCWCRATPPRTEASNSDTIAACPAWKEYVLIDLDPRATDCYRKGTDGLWVLYRFARGESVALAGVALMRAAKQLFADIRAL